MKKIVYSGIVKFVAVILFMTSVVLGIWILTDGIIVYHDEKMNVYSFESDFSDSGYISSLLNEPEWAVVSAYHQFAGNGYHFGQEIDLAENGEIIAQNIKERFENFYHADKIDYFVQWNDVVITNCNAASPEVLMQGEFYSYVWRDGSGNVDRSSTHEQGAYFLEDLARADKTSTIVISCSVKQAVAEEYKAIWEKQEAIVVDTVVQTLVCVAAALLLLVYLICVCGKNKDGEDKNMWLDNIYTEIHLAAVVGAGVGAGAVWFYALDEYMAGYYPKNLIYLAIGTVSALASVVIISSLLSFFRNIKTRRLVETSIILRLWRWLWHIFIKALKWIYRRARTSRAAIVGLLSQKTGVILIGMFFVYTAIIGIFGVCTRSSPIWLVWGVVLFGFASFAIAYRAKDLDEVKKGVSQVRNGNVAYKIPEPKCEDMKKLAGDINDIAEGLDESVAARVKAERMKTELITNVSHDLKTPITSIINYTELLSKIDRLPEEARDYVSVIAKKSDRLKKLTQDLFDISKVQSGNENVVLEKLDVALLVSQSLGEHDGEIQSSGLPFCVEIPKELYISADGRKMSRVVSNLIHNILKYAMKNTRVFITATEKDEEVVMEFKNISAYPLNFCAEEITQRFVRGDEARTAEGNGLGLAIAKSYTELCNGTLEIVIDGDMFKAILKFKKYC